MRRLTPSINLGSILRSLPFSAHILTKDKLIIRKLSSNLKMRTSIANLRSKGNTSHILSIRNSTKIALQMPKAIKHGKTTAKHKDRGD